MAQDLPLYGSNPTRGDDVDFKVTLDNNELAAVEVKLAIMNQLRFDAVRIKQITQMRNRAVDEGYTPVSTEVTRPGGPHGELRLSASVSEATDEMGYTKEYAPHVEYGHRTINGGYVEGQRFLKANVDTQRFIYFQDLLKAIRKG